MPAPGWRCSMAPTASTGACSNGSLLAVAERRGLDEVATLDLRDFGIYRIGQDRRLRLTDFDAAPRPVRARWR